MRPMPFRHKWGPCAVMVSWQTPHVVTVGAGSHFNRMPYMACRSAYVACLSVGSSVLETEAYSM